MTRSKPTRSRPFLKWAGGKYELVSKIQEYLPDSKVLIEPFIGAGSVFLNTDYDNYILNDINSDLINLFKTIQSDAEQFVNDAKILFSDSFNSEDKYYSLRDEFNNSDNPYRKSVIFLYLNKLGYNGLCRYNKSGKFNVPFGRHKTPSFPQKHIEFFAEKTKNALFLCEDFKATFEKATRGDVVYCDPPYAPLSASANFSTYAREGFNLDDHVSLAREASNAASRGITVVVSNHDTAFTRQIYQGAEIFEFSVRRNISRNSSNRKSAQELIAVFKGMENEQMR